MRTLHTLNKASLSHSAGYDCMRALADGDTLVLIEDAVYLTQRKLPVNRNIDVCAIQHDLHTRGLSPLEGHTRIINDSDYVELCLNHDKIVSWF